MIANEVSDSQWDRTNDFHIQFFVKNIHISKGSIANFEILYLDFIFNGLFYQVDYLLPVLSRRFKLKVRILEKRVWRDGVRYKNPLCLNMAILLLFSCLSHVTVLWPCWSCSPSGSSYAWNFPGKNGLPFLLQDLSDSGRLVKVNSLPLLTGKLNMAISIFIFFEKSLYQHIYPACPP